MAVAGLVGAAFLAGSTSDFRLLVRMLLRTFPAVATALGSVRFGRWAGADLVALPPVALGLDFKLGRQLDS